MAFRRDEVDGMMEVEFARQPASLMAARAAGFRRLLQVVHAGGCAISAPDGCAHEQRDLLDTCRVCGTHVPSEGERA